MRKYILMILIILIKKKTIELLIDPNNKLINDISIGKITLNDLYNLQNYLK